MATDKNAGFEEENLLHALSQLIEQGKRQVVAQANSTLTLLFWQVGKRINDDVLQNKRADYGKQIVATVAIQLENKYGRNFTEKNLRRMMQFAEVFPDFEIVVTLSRQLNWSHFLVLIPLKSQASRLFYAALITNGFLSVRELRKQIASKAFERTEIASLQISGGNTMPPDTFKDPYLLDFLDLQNTYLEKDLEQAILRELEAFILELGKGFAFVERQKRIIIDGEDFYLDLLFYHRHLKRLVAIELKLGKFKAAHKGQMELYLKWLDKHEKQAGELPPVGLILCAESSREQVELLEMHKDGIMVAEYWTELPPKKELEQKLHSILVEAQERMGKTKCCHDNRQPWQHRLVEADRMGCGRGLAFFKDTILAGVAGLSKSGGVWAFRKILFSNAPQRGCWRSSSCSCSLSCWHNSSTATDILASPVAFISVSPMPAMISMQNCFISGTGISLVHKSIFNVPLWWVSQMASEMARVSSMPSLGLSVAFQFIFSGTLSLSSAMVKFISDFLAHISKIIFRV